MQQHFFLGGTYAGSSPRRSFLARGLDYQIDPPSLSFFCSVCGEVYAKAPVARDDGSTTPWRAVPACCQRCAPPQFYNNPPGSLYLAVGFDPDLASAFPYAVLKWEFERHIDWYFKEKYESHIIPR